MNINKRQLKRKIKRNEILFEFSFSVLNYFCLLNPFCIWFQVSLGIKKNSVKTTKHAKLLLNENKYLFLMLFFDTGLNLRKDYPFLYRGMTTFLHITF